jgi:hypothetical protein
MSSAELAAIRQWHRPQVGAHVMKQLSVALSFLLTSFWPAVAATSNPPPAQLTHTKPIPLACGDFGSGRPECRTQRLLLSCGKRDTKERSLAFLSPTGWTVSKAKGVTTKGQGRYSVKATLTNEISMICHWQCAGAKKLFGPTSSVRGFVVRKESPNDFGVRWAIRE